MYYDDLFYDDLYDTGFLAGIGIAVIILWFFFIMLTMLLVCARYVSISVIFTKAGEAPWKSLIPFYDMYTLFKISWNKKMFIPYICGIAVSIISIFVFLISIFYAISYMSTNRGYFDPYPTAPSLVLCEVMIIIYSLSLIFAFVFKIMMYYHLSLSFGEGAGFTVGLVLLELIFLMILSFGKYKYIGGKSASECMPAYSYKTPETNSHAPGYAPGPSTESYNHIYNTNDVNMPVKRNENVIEPLAPSCDDFSHSEPLPADSKIDVD